MRKHGWQAPLDPHQVGSIVLFGALAAGCYAFLFPFVESTGVRIALVVLYTLLVLFVVTLNIMSSGSDPSDPGLQGGNEGEFYCAICQASVGRTSKHCRTCDRCVEGFDHHCKWLNNCIGSRNYRPFFLLVATTISMLTVQLAWAVWLFALSFSDKDSMKERVEEKYSGRVVYQGWQVALVLYTLLLLAAVGMLGELFSFHCVLIYKGMTTYDYIIAQREQRLSSTTTGSTAHPAPSAGNFRLLLCGGCKSTRVHDTTQRSESQLKRSLKVSLNPCTALNTAKLNGSPQLWDKSRNAALSMPAGKGVPPVSESSMLGGSAVMEHKGFGTVSMQELINAAAAKEGHPAAAAAIKAAAPPMEDAALTQSGPHAGPAAEGAQAASVYPQPHLVQQGVAPSGHLSSVPVNGAGSAGFDAAAAVSQQQCEGSRHQPYPPPCPPATSQPSRHLGSAPVASSDGQAGSRAADSSAAGARAAAPTAGVDAAPGSLIFPSIGVAHSGDVSLGPAPPAAALTQSSSGRVRLAAALTTLAQAQVPQ